MMHRVKIILVHNVYGKSVVATECGKKIHKIGKRNIKLVNIRKHYHCKILTENALRNINDVRVTL